MIHKTKNNEFKIFCCPYCGCVRLIVDVELQPKCLICGASVHEFIDTGYTDWQLVRMFASNETGIDDPIYKAKKEIWDEEMRKLHVYDNPLFDKVKSDYRIAKQLSIKNNTPPPVKCPKCNSMSISTNRRGWRFITGLLGANKMINTCQSCGHQWRPGKK